MNFCWSEFDEEMKKTRTTLERIPEDKKDFAPHPKSMPLNKLAPHVAQLAGFGLSILTTPELDFAKSSYKPLPFESAAQLVSALDEGAAKVRAAFKSTPDEAWTQPGSSVSGARPSSKGRASSRTVRCS